MLNIKNKNLLVAGIGGIGYEIVNILSNMGANLCLIDIDEDRIRKIKEENRCVKLAIKCDFNEINGLEQNLKCIPSEFGKLDGFVFCAGITGSRPLKMLTYDVALKVMNINFFSFVEMVRCLTKRGNFNHGFSIVGISSVGAMLGNASQTAYTASKAAMNGAVRSMAIELAEKSIRINTIAPGTTDTNMFRQAQNDYGTDSKAFSNRLERQYLGLCQPIDIANTVLFLLSDMSRMITGSCIAVDGGKLTS